MVAASPALLHLVCQTILVTCQHEADQLDKQLPDPAMRQPYVPHQILRLQLCKRLLLAMQVQPTLLLSCTFTTTSVARLFRSHTSQVLSLPTFSGLCKLQR